MRFQEDRSGRNSFVPSCEPVTFLVGQQRSNPLSEAGTRHWNNCSRLPIPSASSGRLSVRSRRMRGKRTANPDLCRSLRLMPSNPSSKTRRAFTVRTGPNRSVVFLRIHPSNSRTSASVRPE